MATTEIWEESMRIPSTLSGIYGLPDPKKVANALTVAFIIAMTIAVLSGVDFKSIAAQ